MRARTPEGEITARALRAEPAQQFIAPLAAPFAPLSTASTRARRRRVRQRQSRSCPIAAIVGVRVAAIARTTRSSLKTEQIFVRSAAAHDHDQSAPTVPPRRSRATISGTAPTPFTGVRTSRSATCGARWRAWVRKSRVPSPVGEPTSATENG